MTHLIPEYQFIVSMKFLVGDSRNALKICRARQFNDAVDSTHLEVM